MADMVSMPGRRLVMGVILLLLTACTSSLELMPSPTPRQTLGAPVKLHGVAAESALPMLRAAASAYQDVNPQVEITTAPLAEEFALQALNDGDAGFALLGWLPSALPETTWVQPIAREGLAIIVNPQNGLPGMTMEQLRELYLGRVEDWSSWGGLPGVPLLVSREQAAGEFDFFQAWVMREARVSSNALLAPNSEWMLNYIAEQQLAVGYVSAGWLDTRVRAVGIDGLPPSPEAVAANVYPLTRTWFLAANGEPVGINRDFITWLGSSEGVALMRTYGWQPVAVP